MLRHQQIKQMIIISLFAAIMCIISPLSVPFGAIPISLSTFVLYITASFLGKKSVITMIIYSFLGIIGLPVFAGGVGGFEKLIGPTGGYIVGYIASAAIIGVISDKYSNKKCILTLSIIFGTMVLYIFGTVWFSVVTGNSILSAVTVCIVPFIPGDALKIFAAVIIIKLIGNRIRI